MKVYISIIILYEWKYQLTPKKERKKNYTYSETDGWSKFCNELKNRSGGSQFPAILYVLTTRIFLFQDFLSRADS